MHLGCWLRLLWIIILSARDTLVPLLLPESIIDIFITALFMIYVVVKTFNLTLDIGTKLIRQKKIMMLWEWIKSFINADNFLRSTQCKRHNHTCSSQYCPRYITPRKKGRQSRIAYKNKRPFDQIFTCKAVTQDKESSVTPDSTDNSSNDSKLLHIDSDSFIIGVDSHASRCIDNNIAHFVGPLEPVCHSKVKGIKGWLDIKGKGTVHWQIEDDEGRKHMLVINDVLYVPDVPTCLLSPQHWMQQAKDFYPIKHGTWCAIYHDECILHWKQQKYKRMLSWDPQTNTAQFRLAGGATCYHVFAATHDASQDIEHNEHVIFIANADANAGPHVIPEDDDEDKGERTHADLTGTS